MVGVANMAAFSREIGISTEAGFPHMFSNAFRNVAALVADIEFIFKEVEPVALFLEDPEAYTSANPAVAAPSADSSAPVEKKEKKFLWFLRQVDTTVLAYVFCFRFSFT